jgi:hypothetical protein
MPLNEPRIYEVRPKWAWLPEIERDERAVWFRTRSGRIRASLKDVQEFERKQKMRRKG